MDRESAKARRSERTAEDDKKQAVFRDFGLSTLRDNEPSPCAEKSATEAHRNGTSAAEEVGGGGQCGDGEENQRGWLGYDRW